MRTTVRSSPLCAHECRMAIALCPCVSALGQLDHHYSVRVSQHTLWQWQCTDDGAPFSTFPTDKSDVLTNNRCEHVEPNNSIYVFRISNLYSWNAWVDQQFLQCCQCCTMHVNRFVMSGMWKHILRQILKVCACVEWTFWLWYFLRVNHLRQSQYFYLL